MCIYFTHTSLSLSFCPTAATGDSGNETSAGALGTPEKVGKASAGTRVGEAAQRTEAAAT